MMGADIGVSTSRAECASAMRHPGSASCKLSADPHMVVLGVALLRFIMDFIYITTMQMYVTLFVLAAVAASGDNSSNARLEDTVASKAVMPGFVSGGAKAKSADCSSNASLEEAVDTRIPKKVTPGSASAVSKAKPARAKRFMVMAVVAIAFAARLLALSSLAVFTTRELHEDLQEQARRNYDSFAFGFNDSGVEGWAVLFRAGGPWHEKLENETWKGQALPATSGRRSFFLHVGAFVDVIDGGGQHLVIPMTDDTRDWRAAVLERVRAAHPSLVPFVASMRCTLNGKEVGAVCRPEDLEDATLRWRSPGLLGGAPKAQDVAMTRDVDVMKKDALMS